MCSVIVQHGIPPAVGFICRDGAIAVGLGGDIVDLYIRRAGGIVGGIELPQPARDIENKAAVFVDGLPQVLVHIVADQRLRKIQAGEVLMRAAGIAGNARRPVWRRAVSALRRRLHIYMDLLIGGTEQCFGAGILVEIKIRAVFADTIRGDNIGRQRRLPCVSLKGLAL